MNFEGKGHSCACMCLGGKHSQYI